MCTFDNVETTLNVLLAKDGLHRREKYPVKQQLFRGCSDRIDVSLNVAPRAENSLVMIGEDGIINPLETLFERLPRLFRTY